MINADMRNYDFYLYSDPAQDDYGQSVLSEEPQGKIRIAIFTTTQAVQDNINYSTAQYVGMTTESINDRFVIDYEGQKLKVLYVLKKGRFNQAFMGAM